VSLPSDSARDWAKEVALQSIVLLENRGILPLDASKEPKVAVIGPTADDQLAMFSGYSFKSDSGGELGKVLVGLSVEDRSVHELAFQPRCSCTKDSERRIVVSISGRLTGEL
jgi:beta-glucosidase-like glycosyl hydrolase